MGGSEGGGGCRGTAVSAARAGRKSVRRAGKRSWIHPWEPDIQQIVLGMNSLTNNQLWEGLKIDDRTKRSKKAMSEISDIMVRLGYAYKQVRESGERERKWVKKTKVQEIAF